MGCHVVVVTRSITTLGDSLLARGQLFAAQFCYIVSEADWGTLNFPTTKLLLLLSFAAGAAYIEAFATTAVHRDNSSSGLATRTIKCPSFRYGIKIMNQKH